MLVVGVLSAVGILVATRTDPPSIHDVPVGLSDVAVDVVRSDASLTISVRGRSAGAAVQVCPGLVAGPSDAPGIRERVRVSGCIGAQPVPSTEPPSWTVAFSAIDAERFVAFDAAERWLIVVTDPDRPADDPAALAGAWIPGGPLLPAGPLLP
jgi:hypothetical protein